MTDIRGELLANYEELIGLVKTLVSVNDRLFRALSQVADVSDEDLEAICAAAKLLEKAEAKGYI